MIIKLKEIMIMGISMESTEWLLFQCFQVELEFGNVVFFFGGRKNGVPGEKPSKKDENQQQLNSTHM